LIYLDTSVLGKAYYREPDSARFRELLEKRLPEIATASLSYAEFFSGLHRKLRLGDINGQDYRRAAQRFDADWEHLSVVPLAEEVLSRARLVIERHALRAGDAIQLASALTLAHSMPVQFSSADRRLNDAAQREGLAAL